MTNCTSSRLLCARSMAATSGAALVSTFPSFHAEVDLAGSAESPRLMRRNHGQAGRSAFLTSGSAAAREVRRHRRSPCCRSIPGGALFPGWERRTSHRIAEISWHCDMLGRAIATDVESAVPRALDLRGGWAVLDVRTPAVVDHATPRGLEHFRRDRVRCRHTSMLILGPPRLHATPYCADMGSLY